MLYNNLDRRSIRLLYVEPGEEWDPIICTLSAIDLGATPDYEALSYTWGHVVKRCGITCDGQDVFVTENLDGALRHIRRPDQGRLMWIDALCINQEDDHEKNHQVRLMPEIYARAAHVLVWLGEECQTDDLAFALIDRFASMFAIHGYFDYSAVDNIAKNMGFPPAEADEWTALARLYQRQWFQRVWVIQEAVMARMCTVTCGSFTASWELIAQVALSFRTNGYMGSHETAGFAPGTYSTVLISDLKISNHRPLLELLQTTRNYLSTDPRDRIFALMEVASNVDSGVVINYSTSTEKLYTTLAVHSLKEHNSLICLSSAGLASESEGSTLPSWVPDWRHNNDNRFNLGHANVFQATPKSMNPLLMVSPDSRVLTISGYLVDNISQVSHEVYRVADPNVNPTLPSEQRQRMQDFKQGYDRLHLMLQQAYPHATSPEDIVALDDMLWRTLCCDLTPEGNRAPEFYGIGFRVFRTMLQNTSNEGYFDPNGGTHEERVFVWQNLSASQACSNAVRTFNLGRNVCFTRDRRMGRVPHGTKVGDVICLLLGGQVPYVIRDDGDGFWKLIGECYIYGIMDGEIMQRRDLREHDFQIR